MVETKPDLTPVTEADRAVERALRERLAAARPRTAVIGEEYGADRRRRRARRWIIDPIDGTKSYVRGIPAGRRCIGAVGRGRGHGRRRLDAGAATSAGGRPAATARSSRRPAPIARVSAVEALADSPAGVERDRGLGRGRPPRRDARARRAPAGARAASATPGSTCWSRRASAEIALDPVVVALGPGRAIMLVIEEAGGRFTDLAGVRTRRRAASGDRDQRAGARRRAGVVGRPTSTVHGLRL